MGVAFNIKEFKIPGKERSQHIEHIGRHQEIDKHGLQNLVPEVPEKTCQIQHRSHTDVIEQVEGV